MNEKDESRSFERFVLKQVYRYAANCRAASMLYLVLIAACVLMAVLAVVLNGQWLGALVLISMPLMFYVGYRSMKDNAAYSYRAALKMEQAIDDPSFSIPYDYDEEVLNVRSLVLPTPKNVVGQAVAYGVIALSCWAGAAIIAAVSGIGGSDFSPVLLFSALIMAVMAFVLSLLSIKAIRDIRLAIEYSRYLNEEAQS